MGTPLAIRFPGVFAASGAAGGLPYGLIDFGTNNDSKFYSIPHDALLDLGSGAWAWACWTQVDTNAGTAYQYLLSSGVQPNTPSFVWYLGEASADIAGEQNRWVARIVDDAGVNTGALISSAITGGDGVLRLMVLQSTGTTIEMWSCPVGGTATRVVNSSVNLGALTAPVNWNFGRRTDGNNARYYKGKAGGPLSTNVALTQAQIELIAGGASPVTVLGAGAEEYWPFKNTTIGVNETGVVASTVATAQTAGAVIARDGDQNFQNFNTSATPWDGSRTFTSSANLIIVILSYEQNQTVSSVAIDPAGANIALSQITSVIGSSGFSRVAIWGAYAFTAQTGSKVVRATFSGSTSGAMAIWTFTGATKLPTTGDFNTQNNGGASATSLTGSITVDSGEESGFILGGLCINNNIHTITSGGGLVSTLHTNTGASGGQINAFSHNLGPLSGTEAPSFSWPSAERCAAAFVLVI